MSPMTKAVGVGVVAWVGAGFAAVFALGVVAATTSKLGASAVGPYLLGVIALEAVLFVSAWLLSVRYSRGVLQGPGRIAFALGFAVLHGGAFVTLAFSSLVAFNR
jgi:hypothetical protein